MLSPSHFAVIALTVAGAAIYTHESEQGDFEEQARELAAGACAGERDPQRCEVRAAQSRDDCFMITFKPGYSPTKFDHGPAHLDSRDYLACIKRGFEPWREARNERRREEARLRRL